MAVRSSKQSWSPPPQERSDQRLTGTVGKAPAGECKNVITLRSREFKPRRPYPRGWASAFLLHLLDELHKLGHGVQAQQGQEPAIEGIQLSRWAALRQLEKADRLFWKRIHQSGNPADCSSRYTLDHHIIH